MDVLVAANDKARRSELKKEIARYDGRILLLSALQVRRRVGAAGRTAGAEGGRLGVGMGGWRVGRWAGRLRVM
eukprot:2890857-Prymnesium_polylepis.1